MNKRILLISFSTVCIVILIFLGAKWYSQEKNYEKALNLIKNEDCQSAIKLLGENLSYQNSSALVAYCQANLIAQEGNLTIGKCSEILNILDANIPNNYSGEFSLEIANLYDAISKTRDDLILAQQVEQAKQLQQFIFERRQKIIDEVINLLDNFMYSEAYERLRVIGSIDGEYYEDEQIQALRTFSLDMALGGISSNSFGGISPDYSGAYSQEISQTILQFISREQWEIRHKHHLEIMAIIEADRQKPLPTIGMTAEEVESSRWGKPYKINSTTTAYTIFEQWVYTDNRYIYLENGIVVAIQE